MGAEESFYGNNFLDFNNSIYAVNIAIEQFLASKVLNGDLSRIIYASNDFCFRKRASKNGGTLNLPFINYYLTGIELDSSPRSLFNHVANIDGVYFPELNRKLRLAPVKLTYECTFWIDRPEDNLYAYYRMHDVASNETVIYSFLELGEDRLKFANFMDLSLELNPNYKDSDWIEMNRIQSITLDFELTSYLTYNNYEFAISNEVIFNFLTAKGLNRQIPLQSEAYTLLTEYFTYIPVTAITLNKSTTTLASGNSETLVATITPSNASNKDVIWESTDSSIIAVGENTGIITGILAGTATITATSEDGNLTASCVVTVT